MIPPPWIAAARLLSPAAVLVLLWSCAGNPDYDLVIRGGTIYDGSGQPGTPGDVAVAGDRIAYVGPKAPGAARIEIDATGHAVTPGFINMLSTLIPPS
jgi:N-acyl-D-amino-acid deacylase